MSTSLALRLLDRGWLPDWVVRAGIRRRLRRRLRVERELTPEAARQFRESLNESPVAIETRAANEQHYELPPEFFERVLGRHRKYSCGLWEDGTTSLDQAEAAMLELTARRADIADGHRILDLGCGWGSFTLWAAQRFPNSQITGVSNSAPQRDSILQRAADNGLQNVEVITADVNQFEPPGTPYDRVVSVEMFEHVRNYRALMKRIASWLAPDGRLFVHIFCHREFAYPFEVRDDNDWMARHFFTGGTMPSDDLLPGYQDHLQAEEHWHVPGWHYQRTAEAWLSNFDRHRTGIATILRGVYGDADLDTWINRWRTFFLACSEMWGYADGAEWFVSHYRFKPATPAGQPMP